MKIKNHRILILCSGVLLIILALHPQLVTTHTLEPGIAPPLNKDYTPMPQSSNQPPSTVASTTKDNPESYTFNPIGIVHSPYSKDKRPPRQGRLAPDVPAKIEIYPEFQPGLEGLDMCNYIIVLFVFDQSQGWHAKVTPHGAAQARGVFSTRSPNRPCPIGLTIVRLDKIEGRFLHISGIDAFDQTPILDIKPYVKGIDSIPGDTKKLEKELGLKESLQ
jgi:tRNA (adenine37-N6)-methyltransferase